MDCGGTVCKQLGQHCSQPREVGVPGLVWGVGTAWLGRSIGLCLTTLSVSASVASCSCMPVPMHACPAPTCARIIHSHSAAAAGESSRSCGLTTDACGSRTSMQRRGWMLLACACGGQGASGRLGGPNRSIGFNWRALRQLENSWLQSASTTALRKLNCTGWRPAADSACIVSYCCTSAKCRHGSTGWWWHGSRGWKARWT